MDYAEIARRALQIMETGRFRLLEALGAKLGSMILEYATVRRAEVLLEKPRALDFAHVGIEMHFDREETR